MKVSRYGLCAALVMAAVLGLTGCDSDKPGDGYGDGESKPLVLYCGRKVKLVKPLLDRFTEETGIEIELKDGSTTKLTATLQTEGDKSPADVFWAQDPGSLSLLAEAGLFAEIPESLRSQVASKFVDPQGRWVSTSGRARVVAYSPKRVQADALPKSVFDLTDPKWRGRVGWAPTNSSFLAFVTAMRAVHGDAKTLAWIKAMKANGAKSYAKNTPIIEAIAAGEVDLGIPNHYYLLRFKKKNGKDYPVDQAFFGTNGDIGNLMMVTGVGVVKSSKNTKAAERFIQFLLSPKSQDYLTQEVYEYPVVKGVKPHDLLADPATLLKVVSDASVKEMTDLKGTKALLKEAGLGAGS